jgi:LysM repeat protein
VAVPVATPAYPSGVFTINNLRVLWADEGTSLLALAAQHGISYRKLFDFNELPDQEVLAKGQLIFLEKKKRTGAQDVHVVLPTETLEQIAQQEGVQAQSLRALNKMPAGTQPAPGERLQLRSPAASQPRLAKVVVEQA